MLLALPILVPAKQGMINNLVYYAFEFKLLKIANSAVCMKHSQFIRIQSHHQTNLVALCFPPNSDLSSSMPAFELSLNCLLSVIDVDYFFQLKPFALSSIFYTKRKAGQPCVGSFSSFSAYIHRRNFLTLILSSIDLQGLQMYLSLID